MNLLRFPVLHPADNPVHRTRHPLGRSRQPVGVDAHGDGRVTVAGQHRHVRHRLTIVQQDTDGGMPETVGMEVRNPSLRQRLRQWVRQLAVERLLNERSQAIGRKPVFLSGYGRPLDQAVGLQTKMGFDDENCDGGYCGV